MRARLEPFLAQIFGTFIGFAFFLFYGLTQSSSVGLEDSGGFLITACHAGLSHPPGYPLWNLLAYFFSVFPLSPTCASRIHWFQAFLGGATLFLFFQVVVFLNLRPKSRPFLFIPVFITVVLGLSFSFAFQARVAEVYIFHCFLCLFLLLALKKEKHLLFFFLLGASLTNHWPLVILWIVSIAIAIPNSLRTLSKYFQETRLKSISFFLLGFSPILHYFLVTRLSDFYFYYPIESLSEAIAYFLRKDQLIKDSLPSWNWKDSMAFTFGFGGRIWEELGLVPAILLLPFSLFSRWSLSALILPMLLPFLWKTEPNAFTLEMFGYWEIQSYVLVLLSSGSVLLSLQNKFEESKFVPEGLKIGIIAFMFGCAGLWLCFYRIPALATLSLDTFPQRYAKIILDSLPPNSILLTFADTESGSLGYYRYGESFRSDIRLVSQVSALFPERIFDRRKKTSNEERRLPLLQFFSKEMLRGNRIFLTRSLEAFDEKTSPFPLPIQKWGAVMEIQDQEIRLSSETPFPHFRLQEISDLLESESEKQLLYVRSGSSWNRYREFLYRDLCYTLFLGKVSLENHPILGVSSECLFQEAQILSSEQKRFEDADTLFRDALPRMTHLYRSEINDRWRDFVLNRVAWAKTLEKEQGKNLLLQTITTSMRPALEYPFCKNRHLLLLEEVSRHFPDSPVRSLLLKAVTECRK